MDMNPLNDIANAMQYRNLEKKMNEIENDMQAIKNDMQILMSETNRLTDSYSQLSTQLANIEDLMKTLSRKEEMR